MMDHEIYLWLMQLTKRIEKLEKKNSEDEEDDVDDNEDDMEYDEDNKEIEIKKSKEKSYEKDRLLNTR